MNGIQVSFEMWYKVTGMAVEEALAVTSDDPINAGGLRHPVKMLVSSGSQATEGDEARTCK